MKQSDAVVLAAQARFDQFAAEIREYGRQADEAWVLKCRERGIDPGTRCNGTACSSCGAACTSVYHEYQRRRGM